MASKFKFSTAETVALCLLAIAVVVAVTLLTLNRSTEVADAEKYNAQTDSIEVVINSTPGVNVPNAKKVKRVPKLKPQAPQKVNELKARDYLAEPATEK